jgi:hypothetical protein
MSCFGILGCGSLPVSRARVESVRASIARVAQAGALSCAPRELALARAHYDFARIELRNGNAARAERHIAVAEQNVGAAQVLTPDRGCKTGSDQTPTIPSTSVRARSAALDAADGGVAALALPLGAVKDTDASRLILQLSERTDSRSAFTDSRMSQHDQSCGSVDLRSLRLAISEVNRASLTRHLYGETRLDDAFAMSYFPQDLQYDTVFSNGGFDL